MEVIAGTKKIILLCSSAYGSSCRCHPIAITVQANQCATIRVCTLGIDTDRLVFSTSGPKRAQTLGKRSIKRPSKGVILLRVWTPPICPCSGTPVWCLPCMQARDERKDDYVTSHFLIFEPDPEPSLVRPPAALSPRISPGCFLSYCMMLGTQSASPSDTTRLVCLLPY